MKTITCLTRDANNFCTKCFSGYQLDFISYQCVKLPSNCAVMNTTSRLCTNCTSGTTLNNNICVFTTTNCQTYDVAGYCQICVAGFVQVNRLCVPVSANCQTYLANDQSKCSVCLPGYRLSAQQCSLVIAGCLVYSSSNACLSCSQGYLLANGTCYVSDPNCLSQDTNGNCNLCQNGYLPFKGGCVYYDPYCLAYNPSTMICNQTMSPFSLNGFSLEQSMYYLNFVMKASSLAQSPASSDFNGGSGKGSYTKNGLITSLPYAGLGSSIISSYDLNGNVLSCQQGYTLVNSQCVVFTQNCLNYNQYATCQQCNQGFDLLPNNSCAARSSATCVQQANGVCGQAASGYSLIGGAAYFAGNNIASKSANGLITAAASGYFVWSANNIAWPLDANCVKQN